MKNSSVFLKIFNTLHARWRNSVNIYATIHYSHTRTRCSYWSRSTTSMVAMSCSHPQNSFPSHFKDLVKDNIHHYNIINVEKYLKFVDTKKISNLTPIFGRSNPSLLIRSPNVQMNTVRFLSNNTRGGYHPLKSTISSLQAKKRVQRKRKKSIKDGTDEAEEQVKGFYSAPHSFLTYDPGLKSPETPIKKSTPKRDWQVTAYSTADEYDLKSLLEGLVDQGLYMQASQHKGRKYELADINLQHSTLLQSQSHHNNFRKSNSDPDEVLHMVETYHITDEPREIYFFRDGAVIFWNVPEIECENILRFLTRYESGSYDFDVIMEESESLSYSYSETKTRLMNDTILLKTDGDVDLEKYTFSNALSMSVKLGIWEESLERYIEKIEYVVEELSTTGRVVLKQEEVLQKMGQLFALRHMLNLSSDFLDIPDFYWDYPHLELLFKRTCSILSINKRTSVMNEKINHCVELMELLKSHLGEKHSARLEWIIIILIMVEVLFELLHFIK